MPTKSARRIAKTHSILALFALGIVILLLTLFQAIKLTQTFFSPWQTSHDRGYRWNGDFNINFIIRSKSISLVSYSPKNQNIIIINIPDETYIEVAHGFGNWQLRSIYGLGGAQLLKDSLISFFALPIDGFLDFSGEFSQKEPNEIVSEFRKNPATLFGILPSVKTDLTLFEMIRLKMGLSSVRFDKINKIDLSLANVLEKRFLADSTQVYIADSIKLNSLYTNLADPTITSEHKTIAVFNATDHPNLAQKAARLISNIGGDVIIVSNSEKRLDKTQILGEQSKTKVRLKQIFIENGKQSLPFSDEKRKIEPNLEGLASSRAQIDLFLGEDYFNSF